MRNPAFDNPYFQLFSFFCFAERSSGRLIYTKQENCLRNPFVCIGGSFLICTVIFRSSRRSVQCRSDTANFNQHIFRMFLCADCISPSRKAGRDNHFTSVNGILPIIQSGHQRCDHTNRPDQSEDTERSDEEAGLPPQTSETHPYTYPFPNYSSFSVSAAGVSVSIAAVSTFFAFFIFFSFHLATAGRRFFQNRMFFTFFSCFR